MTKFEAVEVVGVRGRRVRQTEMNLELFIVSKEVRDVALGSVTTI
jgi:hypothetical protein